METKMIDTSTEFIYQFVETVPEGERIRLCLQCGACSGACPFGFVMDFPPHGMIAMLRAGLLDDMLKSDTAWMCVSCYACTEVCPAMIPVTAGLTTRVKEEMILAGNVPTELQDALEVKKIGLSNDILQPVFMDLTDYQHNGDVIYIPLDFYFCIIYIKI